VALLQIGVIGATLGAEIEVSNPDVKVRWDNTFKCSAGARRIPVGRTDW